MLPGIVDPARGQARRHDFFSRGLAGVPGSMIFISQAGLPAELANVDSLKEMLYIGSGLRASRACQPAWPRKHDIFFRTARKINHASWK